jgi:hypothetical protein
MATRWFTGSVVASPSAKGLDHVSQWLEKGQGVGWVRQKFHSAPEFRGFFVEGMDKDRSDANDLGDLQRATVGVQKKIFAETLSLPVNVDGKSPDEDERDLFWCVPPDPTRGLDAGDAPCRDAVVANHHHAGGHHEGSSEKFSFTVEGSFPEPVAQFNATAVEGTQVMSRGEMRGGR